MFSRFLRFAIVGSTVAVSAWAAPEYRPQRGERIAIVGGATGERLSQFGNFETLLHSRFPQLELRVLNFSRPADEVALRQRPADYTSLDDPMAVFAPQTLICFFGANESYAGKAGVEAFKSNYEKALDGYARTYGAGQFVLVSPIAFEDPANPLLPDAKQRNADLALYADAVKAVAEKRALPFVDLFDRTQTLFDKEPGAQFTEFGFKLNEAGDREVAQILDRELFGTSSVAKIDSLDFEKLRAAVNDKAWVHRQDYRMLNGWYVYGGRNTWDRETFPPEFAKIRNMVAVRDRYVWDLAQGKPVPAKPDDRRTGELFTPKTMYGSQPKKEPPTLKYPTPEESMKTMQVPEGFEVQLIASEREFPELVKVNQINFDSRGRLWVSCMANYPQWQPGQPKPNDRLLIFSDFAANGRARKCTTFYDQLICPTGFEFWNGGVIVVDEPRLLWLKDTDGDDKADVVVELSDGWATDDTHHTIGAFEYSPGGLLHMLEGVSLSTAVETPWGPHRTFGQPGCHVLDPRTLKLRHFVTPGYGNPWCYVFNWWGQGIVGDGTTPQQHWDSPLSGAQYPGRKGMNTVFDGEGVRPNVGTEFLYTRQFPDDVQGDFIMDCVINVNGLTSFKIGDDGAGFKGARKKKPEALASGGVVESLKSAVRSATGKPKLVPDDLLTAKDNMTFRPVDPQIGPDGALYFGDWSAALIGHMQYSQRDPNRDHTHGRLYRLVYKKKPLLAPATQFGKSIPELLDQLKEYESRTRYRARRELRDRPTADVLAAIKLWTTKLDPADKEYDRLLLEALWVEQGHHAVDVQLLRKVLRCKTPDARAAATHVLADEWERIPEGMDLIKPQVVDDFARTRLEAVRALSFVRTKESVETLLLAAAKPHDYWLDYTFESVLTALLDVWKDEFKNGTIALENQAGIALLQQMQESFKPAGAATIALNRYLTATDLRADTRRPLIEEIAKGHGVADSGKAVFRRICTACHKWGGEGVEYGPIMNGVGTRLKREDIIESILDPNAKIDPKFVTTNIETKDGGAFTGFVAAENDDTLTLKIAGGVTQDFKKTNLKKREAIMQSSMPEGLANAMSPGEFLDLMEFLASLK